MLKIIGAIALSVPLLMLRGYVLAVLWLWFVVPLGVPSINFIHGMGLSILIGLTLTGVARETFKDAENPLLSVIVTSLVMSLLAWGTGAVVHLFM